MIKRVLSIIGLVLSLASVALSYYFFYLGRKVLFWIFLIVGVTAFMYIWERVWAVIWARIKDKMRRRRKKKKSYKYKHIDWK